MERMFHNMEKKIFEPRWNWRDKLVEIGLIVFVLSLAGAYFLDAYVYHPIPAPKDTELCGSYFRFDLAQSNGEYADATVLYENMCSNGDAIIMAEKDGKIHLLCYAMHYPTQRRRLVDDQTIEPGMTGVVKLYQGQVELADGEVTFSYARSVSFQKISYGISLMIAIAATFGIMLPLSLLAKFTRRKSQTQ